jgi:SAM-dependent methyltransferase
MTQAFDDKYARYYDLLYSDKDYEGECDFLDEVFRSFASERPKRILDVGCGTGGYSIRLGKRGYEVKGIDLSAAMIDVARGKAEKENVKVDFEVVDVRQLNLGHGFDACTCMFAVIDYLLDNNDLGKALRAVRSHLREDSIFVFDFWNGNAVLNVLPSPRVKTMTNDGLQITRTATPRLDRTRNLCEVNYKCTVRSGTKVIDDFEERHVVRYLFQGEIREHLEKAGFSLRRVCPFPELNGEVKPTSWNLAAVAVAV